MTYSYTLSKEASQRVFNDTLKKLNSMEALNGFKGKYFIDPLGDFETVTLEKDNKTIKLINEYWPMDAVYIDSSVELPEFRQFQI